MPLNANDLEAFMNTARINLTGASDAGVKEALYQTVKEFLKDTNSWVEHLRLPVTVGVQEYLLQPRNGGQVIRIEGVVDGNLFGVRYGAPQLPILKIYTPIQMTTPPVASTDNTTGGDKPWHVCIIKNVDLPTTKDAIPIVPEFVLKRYSEAITSGVLGRMMLQPQKSYSNPQLATYHLRRFKDGIAEASMEARAQNVFGGQRWIFPQNWRTDNQRGGSVATWPAESF